MDGLLRVFFLFFSGTFCKKVYEFLLKSISFPAMLCPNHDLSACNGGGHQNIRAKPLPNPPVTLSHIHIGSIELYIIYCF